MTQNIIQNGETIVLSERDSLLVFDLVDNPPPANAKLRTAIAAFADNFARDRLRDDDTKAEGLR
ncbi:type II toxin -antitoxin system TacA 1-like antitoxin [Kozakia baliensis]|uniref:type II toxin -antitoxin system TacA 1-like antitoxin n=1 Tax=Kozakia baliensis TaxID=153496 RepID=UPI00056166C8|nr:DUF1778 domain-containing protein [Kozakia baliensis]